jgi:hypothetical protein
LRIISQENKLSTVFVSKPEDYFHYMTSPDYTVHGLDCFSDDVLSLTYTMTDELAAASNKVNVILAAFTTCYARLHLLGFLLDRAERTLYFDTG